MSASFNKPTYLQTIDLINKRTDSPTSMRIVDKYNEMKMTDEGGESPRPVYYGGESPRPI